MIKVLNPLPEMTCTFPESERMRKTETCETNLYTIIYTRKFGQASKVWYAVHNSDKTFIQCNRHHWCNLWKLILHMTGKILETESINASNTLMPDMPVSKVWLPSSSSWNRNWKKTFLCFCCTQSIPTFTPNKVQKTQKPRDADNCTKCCGSSTSKRTHVNINTQSKLVYLPAELVGTVCWRYITSISTWNDNWRKSSCPVNTKSIQ